MAEAENLTQEKRAVVEFLNAKFKEGTRADEVLDQLRRLKRPVLIDFNNVIADNERVLTLNPQAPEALSKLHASTDIIIVTTAENWEYVHTFLVENKLWTDDLILMVPNNYRFMSQHALDGGINMSGQAEDQSAIKLITEYIEFRKNNGMNIEPEMFRGMNVSRKQLAPLFQKPYDIPIIDDGYDAVKDNPGMLGVPVRSFDPKRGRPYQDHTLKDAIDQTLEYYIAID